MNQERFGSLIAGFYAWMLTVFLGGILLDIVYANRLQDALSNREITRVFSEVSDFLLLPGFMTLLAGFGAVAVSWKSRYARNLFIASLLLLMFEFLIPVSSPHSSTTWKNLTSAPGLESYPPGWLRYWQSSDCTGTLGGNRMCAH